MAQVGRSRPAWGSVAGPPGTGKTTFLLALIKIAQLLGIRVIFVRSKDCRGEEKIEIRGAADLVVKRISSILHFTVSDGLRPSFDLLSVSECTSLQCLAEYAHKEYRSDIAKWIEARIKMLSKFVVGDTIVIPTCLGEEYDELARRLILGLLYVLRNRIAIPIVLDDTMSFVTNEPYSKVFTAMMRPYFISINKDLDSGEITLYNPIVIVPGGHAGVYRLADPYRYVVLFDTQRFTLSRKDIEKIVYS